MRLNEQIRAIHALASMRHPDVSPSNIQVVLSPFAGHPVGAAETGGPSLCDESGPKELADVCDWAASVRLGGREWVPLAGSGPAPDVALERLLRELVTAHASIDARRAKLLERARAVHAEAAKETTPRAAFDVPLPDRHGG